MTGVDRLSVIAHWAKLPERVRMWSPWWLRHVLAVERASHERTMQELREVEDRPATTRGAVHRGDWFRQAWANAAGISVAEAERSFETLGDITATGGQS